MEDFAKRLRKAMELREMKQTDLIDKTGINKGALSCYLSGKYNPKQDNIFLLAKALDVSEVWLMGADVPMERTNTLENKLYEMAEDKQILDLLSQMTDEEKKEMRKHMEYLISKRKDT